MADLGFDQVSLALQSIILLQTLSLQHLTCAHDHYAILPPHGGVRKCATAVHCEDREFPYIDMGLWGQGLKLWGKGLKLGPLNG